MKTDILIQLYVVGSTIITSTGSLICSATSPKEVILSCSCSFSFTVFATLVLFGGILHSQPSSLANDCSSFAIFYFKLTSWMEKHNPVVGRRNLN